MAGRSGQYPAALRRARSLRRSLEAHTGGVSDAAELPRGPWRPWTICLACVVSLAASILLLVADGLAGVMASWDTPAPGRGWLAVAAVGHIVLAGGSITLLAAGLRRPPWRRAAVFLAWAIIPVGVCSFLLFGRLASGA
jgi:hypothetical protein